MTEAVETEVRRKLVLDDLQRLREAQRDHSRQEDFRARTLADLQERIRQGISTGDPITDISILHLGAKETHERKLRVLYDNLRENEGGLVAVYTRYGTLIHDEPQGCFGGGPTYSYNTTLEVGRIRQPYLTLATKTPSSILDGLKIQLVVDPKAVLKSEGLSDRVFQLREEPEVVRVGYIDIFLSHYFGVGAYHPSGCIRLDHFELQVGNENVERFFDGLVFLARDEQNKRFEDKGVFYKRLKGILLDNSELERYVLERDERAETKRQTRIQSLALELLEQHRTYIKETRKIEERVRNAPARVRRQVDALKMPGDVTVLDEMERDFRDIETLAIGSERERLRQIDNEVKRSLEEGLKLGMHKEDVTLGFPEQPGISVNVRDLTLGLCGFYKLKAPD